MNPLGLVGPITLPPRLVLRALEDLHAIAGAASEISGHLEDLQHRGDAMSGQIATAVALVSGIERTAEQALDMAERIDARAQAILEFGERIDARAEAILGLGERVDAIGAAIVDQGGVVEQTGLEVARQGAAVADALPALLRALEIVEPLEGVVERMGRIVDRLPGGRRPQETGQPPRRASKPRAQR